MTIDDENLVSLLQSRSPASMDEVIDEYLKNEGSIIVSPDTCVLLHMVRKRGGDEKFPQLEHLHLWEKEACALEKLIESGNIIWVIPEQVVIEFARNSETERRFCEFKRLLVGDKRYLDEKGSDERYNGFCQKIDEVGRLIKKNRKAIIKAAFVLKYDNREPIYSAWKNVREDEFPNEKGQQMKDSVILQHLLKFQEKLDNQNLRAKLYFWTFDNLGSNSSKKRFPLEASTDEEIEHEKSRPEKLQSYVDIIWSVNERSIFGGDEPMTLRITANDIEKWSDEIDTRHLLPILVRRLINETLGTGGAIIKDFPGYANTKKPGFDGQLISNIATPHIPSGKSVWEMGIGKNITAKATADFNKRKGTAKNDETYVFVSSRNWTQKAEWLTKKQNENPGWQDIRVLDADDLEQWLETCPCTAIWLARQLGKPIDHLEDVNKFLENWLDATSPSFPKEILLNNRDVAKKRIAKIATSAGANICVIADAKEEATAFVCAALSEAELVDRPAVILKSEEAVIEIKNWQDDDIPKVLITESKEISRKIPSNILNKNVVITAGVREDFANYNDGSASSIVRLARVLDFDAIFERHEDARTHYKQTGGSLSALHRRHNKNLARRDPIWHEYLLEQGFIWLALIGRWDETYDADKEFLKEVIEPESYDQWCFSLNRLSRIEDAPLEMTSGDRRGYRLFSRLDAFLSIAQIIQGDHINRFLSKSAEVLSEPDPNDKLGENTRYYLRERRKYSDFIRKGIVEGLIILNLKKGTLGCGDITNKITAFYDKIFAHDRAWISLNDVLPMLAEASPDDFLTQLKKALNEKPYEIQCLFEPILGLIGDDYRHPPLLWALEVLAWDADRLKEISMLFCRLQAKFESSVKDNFINRPSNSLNDIFCSWKPQTSANIKQRLKVLNDSYKEYPHETIQLAKALACDENRMGNYIATPVWRDDALNVSKVTLEERNQTIDCAIDLLKKYLKNDKSPLKERLDIATYAIGEFSWWGKEYTEQFIEIIVQMLEESDLPSEEEAVSKLQKRLRRYLSFPGTCEVEGLDMLSIIRRLLDATEFDDPIIQNTHWFSSWPELEENIEDFDDREEHIETKRTQAIEDIFGRSNIGGIIDLTLRVEDGIAVSDTLYNNLISKDRFPLRDYLIQLLKTDIESHKVHDHLSHIFGRIRGYKPVPDAMSTDKVIKLIESIIEELDQVNGIPNWEDKKIALYHAIRIDDKQGRDYIDNLPDTIQQKYFSRYRIRRGWEMRPKEDTDPLPEENEWIAQKYLEYKRPRLGWQVFRVRKYIPFDSQLELLDAMAIEGRDEGGGDDAFPAGWYIQDFLDEAYNENLDDETKIRVARMEYKFYPHLRTGRKDDRISFIDWWIGKDPAFYIQLHKDVYKTDDGDDDAPKDLDEYNKQTKAEFSWRILWGLNLGAKNFPWIKDEGEIDEDLFMQWIKEVKKLAKEVHRSRIIERSIGQGMGHIVPKEGVKPEESICKILREIESEVIFENFAMGRYNSRGVLTNDKDNRGYTTAGLAEEYEKASHELEYRYPFVAKLMKHMALRYRAQVEEDKAMHERNDLDWR